MAKNSNVIEINGKRYDALSGKLLGDAAATASTPQKPRTAGVSMDGFVTKAAPQAAAVTVPKVAPVSMPTAKPRNFSDFVRTPANHTKPHKANSSMALMRTAVTKPAHSLKRHTKAQQRTDILVKQPSITVKPKLSSYSLDQRRVLHAKQVPRHPEASRYAIKRPVLAVATSQPALAAATAAPASVATPALRPIPASPAPAPRSKASSAARTSTDIFEQALARANSHIEKPTTRRHTKHRRALFGSRALSIGAASLAVLLVVGFLGWQQKANLTMRYAAAKAGVSASLPGYKPAGFTAGKFSYSPGLVAVNFKNASSGDSFALIEKTSTWDSQALLDSFVATKGRTYQTIDAAGRTIYTYGNNNATWVDNGVWYQVNSNGSLTTNQLVQLALSM